jgi:transcriptional regulator with XRE-family HTH domain
MRLQEIGHIIRRTRLARQTTQAQLAEQAGLSRTTINQLESGVVPDLGIRKTQTVLAQLGLTLQVRLAPRRPNYVRMAIASANSGYREKLSESELVRALRTGRIPKGRRPHLRTLFEEAPAAVVRGLVDELGRHDARERVRERALVIAKALGALGRARTLLEGR